MNIKKILNSVDGSEHSIRSTQYAIELAKPLDVHIVMPASRLFSHSPISKRLLLKLTKHLKRLLNRS